MYLKFVIFIALCIGAKTSGCMVLPNIHIEMLTQWVVMIFTLSWPDDWQLMSQESYDRYEIRF